MRNAGIRFYSGFWPTLFCLFFLSFFLGWELIFFPDNLKNKKEKKNPKIGLGALGYATKLGIGPTYASRYVGQTFVFSLRVSRNNFWHTKIPPQHMPNPYTIPI